MTRFLAAIRFLTILPVPGRWGTGAADLAGSAAYFPVVGLLLGIIAAAAATLLAELTPVLVTATLVAVLLAVLSGGRTLEGLFETVAAPTHPVDEGSAPAPPNRSAAKGAAAVAAILLLKVGAVASIPWEYRWAAVLLMPLAGRMSICFHLAALPDAPGQRGGAALDRQPAAPGALLGLLILAGVAYKLLPWHAYSWLGAVVCTTSLGMAVLLMSYVAGKFGGATADTLGAASEIGELVPALVVATWAYRLDPVAIFLLK